MTRPKAFDRDAALAEAIKVFASHGYQGTSTDLLLRRMGIGRQSMYDTFGDKRRLYLEALQRYAGDSTAEIIGALHGQVSARQGLERALIEFASRPALRDEDACLGVGAVCEFGRSDRDVTAVSDAAGATLLAAFESLVRRGQAAREFAAELDPRNAARFLVSTLTGLKVSARGGATPEVLRGIVDMALRSLH
jgi:AcrR family transcriptional regulator